MLLVRVGGLGSVALEGKGPRRRPRKRLDRWFEEVAKAIGGGCCRFQMPLNLALAVSETVAVHRLGALEGGGYLPPLLMHLWGRGYIRFSPEVSVSLASNGIRRRRWEHPKTNHNRTLTLTDPYVTVEGPAAYLGDLRTPANRCCEPPLGRGVTEDIPAPGPAEQLYLYLHMGFEAHPS